MPRKHILENKIHTHTFLTAAQDGGECSILRCCSFTPIKELPISVGKEAAWAPERSLIFGNKNLLILLGLKLQIDQPVVTRLGMLLVVFHCALIKYSQHKKKGETIADSNWLSMFYAQYGTYSLVWQAVFYLQLHVSLMRSSDYIRQIRRKI
jgi:hypothetical protein